VLVKAKSVLNAVHHAASLPAVALVLVLLAGDLIHAGLRVRLLAVRDEVAAYGVSIGRSVQRVEEAYRDAESPTFVTASPTLSTVDLLLCGVIFSDSSITGVSILTFNKSIEKLLTVGHVFAAEVRHLGDCCCGVIGLIDRD